MPTLTETLSLQAILNEDTSTILWTAIDNV